MQTTVIFVTLAAFTMFSDSIGSRLAQKAAKKIVSEAVEEGLGDAFREAALSASLDAIADRSAMEFADRAHDVRDYVEMGALASDGVEAAMRAADVAKRLDNVADAAKAAKKLGKLKKLKR